MNTPLHDFSGLSEQTIDLLWFRADQIIGSQMVEPGRRDAVFEVVLALHRAELKIAALQLAEGAGGWLGLGPPLRPLAE